MLKVVATVFVTLMIAKAGREAVKEIYKENKGIKYPEAGVIFWFGGSLAVVLWAIWS
jgi:hypothetical protein